MFDAKTMNREMWYTANIYADTIYERTHDDNRSKTCKIVQRNDIQGVSPVHFYTTILLAVPIIRTSGIDGKTLCLSVCSVGTARRSIDRGQRGGERINRYKQQWLV